MQMFLDARLRKSQTNQNWNGHSKGLDRTKLRLLLWIISCFLLLTGWSNPTEFQPHSQTLPVLQSSETPVPAPSTFQRAYFISNIQELDATGVITTADGGFLITGIAGNPITRSDVYAIKIDASGSVQWSLIYDGDRYDNGAKPVQLPNGGFLLAGSTCCRLGADVAYLIKINDSGTVEWGKTYRSPVNGESIRIHRVALASDGNLLLVGRIGTFTSWKMFGAKILPDGTIGWARSYDVLGTADYVYDLAPTPDGGALLVGELYQLGQALAFKIDGNGNVEWAKTHNTNNRWVWSAKTTARLSDGDFILSGYVRDEQMGGIGVWVARINDIGEIEWAEYGIPLYEGASQIVLLSDNNLLLTGTSWIGDFRDMGAVKMTPNGDVLWARRYGRMLDDGANAAAVQADGSFLLAGWSNDPSSDMKQDLYIVHADANGSSGCQEAEITPTINTIDQNLLITNTVNVQATSISLLTDQLSPSVSAPVTQSSAYCNNAPLQQIYLPLVLRMP